jgi:riboflavin synthase
LFTGIIEEVGTARVIQASGENRRIQVGCSRILPELKPGDSVSVSGVCLTAVQISQHGFAADLAEETWKRTSFARLKAGALLNLELPMRANGRFDGHVVQGHVDGTGTVRSFRPVPGGNDFELRITVPPELTRYIVAKGSLAIEGISLTVAAIEDMQVRVAIIPHTAEVTNLRSLKTGDPVNLEVDVIAKYVEKMVTAAKARGGLRIEDLVKQGF